MKTTLKLLLTALVVPVFLGTLTAQKGNAQPEKQTRYLSFQIFTYGAGLRGGDSVDRPWVGQAQCELKDYAR